MTAVISDRENFHDVIARRSQEFYLRKRLSPDLLARVIKTRSSVMDDPKGLILYFQMMVGAWILLAVGAVLVMAIPSLIADAISPDARQAVAAAAVALGGFCVAGSTAATWWYYAARIAAHEERTHGASSEKYRRALARARSTERTLPLQLAIAVAAATIALTS